MDSLNSKIERLKSTLKSIENEMSSISPSSKRIYKKGSYHKTSYSMINIHPQKTRHKNIDNFPTHNTIGNTDISETKLTVNTTTQASKEQNEIFPPSSSPKQIYQKDAHNIRNKIFPNQCNEISSKNYLFQNSPTRPVKPPNGNNPNFLERNYKNFFNGLSKNNLNTTTNFNSNNLTSNNISKTKQIPNEPIQLFHKKLKDHPVKVNHKQKNNHASVSIEYTKPKIVDEFKYKTINYGDYKSYEDYEQKEKYKSQRNPIYIQENTNDINEFSLKDFNLYDTYTTKKEKENYSNFLLKNNFETEYDDNNIPHNHSKTTSALNIKDNNLLDINKNTNEYNYDKILYELKQLYHLSNNDNLISTICRTNKCVKQNKNYLNILYCFKTTHINNNYTSERDTDSNVYNDFMNKVKKHDQYKKQIYAYNSLCTNIINFIPIDKLNNVENFTKDKLRLIKIKQNFYNNFNNKIKQKVSQSAFNSHRETEVKYFG